MAAAPTIPEIKKTAEQKMAKSIEAFKTETHSKGWAHVAAMLLDRPQMVEFGRTTGAAAAGYVDEADLVRALRPGFADLLKPEYAHLAGQGVTLLQVVQA